MLYVVKILYSWVLPPGGLILLLLAAAVLLYRRRSRRLGTAVLTLTLLLYATCIPLVGERLIGGLEGRYPQPAPQGDMIVVLGGGATAATPDIDGRGNELGSASGRLLTAVRLHRLTGLPILFSGGQVYPDSGNEANIARRQLLGLGVEESAIRIENRSRSTRENAENTAALLREGGFKAPILVTSAFHLPRAVAEFRQAGMTVQPYPTDYTTNTGGPLRLYAGKLTPSGSAMAMTSLALKEYLGLLAVSLR
ncbi:YdcF family protein [Paenibacillus spiritus]|uniref:YdcF family protein n=1 Tax=Paenibacillus spiritus TaxID=2496557 RepID=A0A5J5G5L7_9BACL|nr:MULTISPECIES: YdcF family protein [Paenibacillus]KAA9002412.1 YdcF family protein [Paenibacillus spiritus]